MASLGDLLKVHRVHRCSLFPSGSPLRVGPLASGSSVPSTGPDTKEGLCEGLLTDLSTDWAHCASLPTVALSPRLHSAHLPLRCGLKCDQTQIGPCHLPA